MDPFIGQIIMFGGNFAPRGWALCEGQLLSIAQYSALFSLIGTIYGGNGRTTFALPDLRGRVPVSQGRGPGLSDYTIGSRGGTEQVTLSITQIPSHNHLIAGGGDGAKLSTERAVRKTPMAGDIPAVTTTKSGLADVEVKSFGPENANSVNAGTASSGGGTIGNTGGNMGHTNVQPFLTVSYIIALQGTFPSRN